MFKFLLSSALSITLLSACTQSDPLGPCLAKGYDLQACQTGYAVYGAHDSHWMDGVGPFVAGMGAMALINHLSAQPRYQTPQYRQYYNDYSTNPSAYTQRYSSSFSRYQPKQTAIVPAPRQEPVVRPYDNPIKAAPIVNDGKPAPLFVPNKIVEPARSAPGVNSTYRQATQPAPVFKPAQVARPTSKK